MRKTLLLSLLLCLIGLGASAQTTHNINLSTTENFTVNQDDTVNFNISASLLTTYTLTCNTAPDGVNTADFGASESNLVVGPHTLKSVVPSVIGEYSFTFKTNGSITNTFTMLVDETLSNNKIEETELSISCTNGLLSLDGLDTSDISKTSILNLSGATVYSSTLASKSIDVSSLTNGIYILVIQESSSRLTQKFIKQ